MRKLRVLLVTQRGMVVDRLRMVLERKPDLGVVSVVEHGHTALEGAPSRAQRTGMGCTPLLHTVLLGWLVVERQLTTPRIAMMWYGNGVYSSTELGHIWCTKILNLNNPNVFLHTCVHYFTFDHRPLHGEMIVQADEIGVHP